MSFVLRDLLQSRNVHRHPCSHLGWVVTMGSIGKLIWFGMRFSFRHVVVKNITSYYLHTAFSVQSTSTHIIILCIQAGEYTKCYISLYDRVFIIIITILPIRERTEKGNLPKVMHRTSAISLPTPALIRDRSWHFALEETEVE